MSEGKGRRGPEVDEELAYHIERLVEEYRAAGMDEATARRAAHGRFGDYASIERACVDIEREEARRAERRDRVGDLRQDIRFALRQLRSHRAATVVAVLTLGLGVGANTAIFSVVNGVLLRALPYPEPERLMVGGFSMPDYRDVVERSRVFDRTTVWASNIYAVRDVARPEEVRGAQVEPAFFEMLGAPILGHAFDARDQHAPVAVISHGLWQRRFAGDPSVIGRSIDLSGTSHTIIGVMPRMFAYPDARFDVWVPLAHAMSGSDQPQNRALRIFRMVARRAPGVSEEAAQADVRGIAAQLEQEHPDTNEGVTMPIRSMREQIVGDVRPALLAMLAAVGLVLFIACVNVGNLQIGQRATRTHELGIRLALGAGRGRLVRQLLTESAVLAAIGGLAGLALAAGIIRILPALDIDLPRLGEVTLDGRVLGFSVAASVLTALLFGIAPAFRGTARVDPARVLREGGRTTTAERGRLRALLASVEVALAVIVLIGAGLLIQSLARVLDEDLGFQPESLISMNIGLFHFENVAQRTPMLERVLERIVQVPGVSRVGAGSGLPPETAQRGTGFEVPGRSPGEAERDGAFWMGATPGYFETLGTRVVQGRAFESTDTRGALPVAIISASLARGVFGSENPIGRQIRLLNPDQDGRLRTIVGVVEDIRYQGMENRFAVSIYTPYAQTPFLWAYVMVRSDLPAERLARPLRDAIALVDERLVPARISRSTELVSSLVAQRRFLTQLLGAFALLALVLAAVGVYGVIASGVAQQRRDIGVRMALGAGRRVEIGRVVAGALALVSVGLIAGVVASLWLTRLIDSMLYDVGATDPATFLSGAVIILTVGICAAAIPAARAAAVDPALVLRE